MAVDQWHNPALVIVDMQNDFVREGAPMEVPPFFSWTKTDPGVGMVTTTGATCDGLPAWS
jgi:nicotinamidase-related amidase